MIPTIIISAVLAAVVGLIIYRMICNAKSKQGGCASCRLRGHMRRVEDFTQGSPIADVRSKKTADWQVRTPIFGAENRGTKALATYDQE